MKTINKLTYKTNSNEEDLPGYTDAFPYIASRAELDKHPERLVPWHWHNALELFYMESGTLEYHTPHGTWTFPAGTGGMLNANVLHMTIPKSEKCENVQFLHLFDSTLISGGKGNLIEQKYVDPIIADSQLEMITLSPSDPRQGELLKKLRESFFLDENEVGYELRLREKLSEIWLEIVKLHDGKVSENAVNKKSNDQIKQMMIYIQKHYSEKISIAQLANEAFLSERGCYRVFQEYLHMTPTDYITSYRLQMACQMLTKEDTSLAEISQNCGLGSSSYFGKVFKENMGCTPLEYRRKWQNSDI